MDRLNFNECTLAKLDKLFQLRQTFEANALQNWLSRSVELTPFEKEALRLHQNQVKIYGHDWNEFELKQQFIGPMFTLVNFASQAYGIFAERKFGGIVNEIELYGKPDGLIASGFREPEKPYFCLQEYKREQDPEGDAAGQCLAAMLVAQEINEHKHPVYGCYVVGTNWYFMTLQDKSYSISLPYVSTRDDIFDIFCILKELKQIVIDLVAQE